MTLTTVKQTAANARPGPTSSQSPAARAGREMAASRSPAKGRCAALGGTYQTTLGQIAGPQRRDSTTGYLHQNNICWREAAGTRARAGGTGRGFAVVATGSAQLAGTLPLRAASREITGPPPGQRAQSPGWLHARDPVRSNAEQIVLQSKKVDIVARIAARLARAVGSRGTEAEC